MTAEEFAIREQRIRQTRDRLRTDQVFRHIYSTPSYLVEQQILAANRALELLFRLRPAH